jgi:hypothetical protein
VRERRERGARARDKERDDISLFLSSSHSLVFSCASLRLAARLYDFSLLHFIWNAVLPVMCVLILFMIISFVS